MRADQAVSYALEHMVDARRGVRRTRPLLPVGGDPLGRAATAGRCALRIRSGLCRGVRLRARPTAALGAGDDQSPRAGRRDVSARTSFVLSGPAGTVVAQGIRTGYPDVAAASAALADGSADVVVGALPFDVRGAGRAADAGVGGFRRRAAGLAGRPASGGADRRDAAAPEEHRARIRAALRDLNDTESGLQKVVLARALRLVADGPLDERTILRRLVDGDAEASVYLADLSPAGERYVGAVLVGASPELLVARFGDQVSCQPFAGSAPRSADPRDRRRQRCRTGRVRQEPARTPARRRHDARRTGTAVYRTGRRTRTPAQPHRRAVASVHARSAVPSAKRSSLQLIWRWRCIRPRPWAACRPTRRWT